MIPRKCLFFSTLSASSEPLLEERFGCYFIFSHSAANGKLEGLFVSPRVYTTNEERISTNVSRKIEKDGDTPTYERLRTTCVVYSNKLAQYWMKYDLFLVFSICETICRMVEFPRKKEHPSFSIATDKQT